MLPTYAALRRLGVAPYLYRAAAAANAALARFEKPFTKAPKSKSGMRHSAPQPPTKV